MIAMEHDLEKERFLNDFFYVFCATGDTLLKVNVDFRKRFVLDDDQFFFYQLRNIIILMKHLFVSLALLRIVLNFHFINIFSMF